MARKQSHSDSPKLFNEQIVPAEPGSGKLFDVEYTTREQPVICLGMTFKDDEARRQHFADELSKKLNHPEFRKIEGFPIGEDEDILNLSDPPYYTACPNPWISDFIAEWESQKPAKPEGWTYHREPFAADVSEGKNDPIYNTHSYHTKVPHKAIMRYILHYTEPGDIVFDGFCGTGMTGIAAKLCGDPGVVSSLGYKIDVNGTVFEEEVSEEGIKQWRPLSKLGARKSILSDLSPAATFIAYNYNTSLNVGAFEKEAKRILDEVEVECGWMFNTSHADGSPGKINYTIWSDVFLCPTCAGEIVFWDVALNEEKGQIREEFACPHCTSLVTKRGMSKCWTTTFDRSLQQTVEVAKQTPVLINYSIGKKVFAKSPDQDDLDLIARIDSIDVPYQFPTKELPDGFNTRQPKMSHGISYTHQFFTKRNLYVVAALHSKTFGRDPHLRDMVVNMLTRANRQSSLHVSNFFHGGGGVCKGHLTGTLYIPSLSPEIPATKIFNDRISTLKRGYLLTSRFSKDDTTILTQSLTSFEAANESVDYLFFDPPFGANINYSEVNFNDECWLGVATNSKHEAIENSLQGKSLDDYRALMTRAFSEAYRILKPGRWMTVEFSNTKASVWNSIQIALSDAGFIVANVSSLDKKLGSFKAVTTPTAVKQDLVISAYKPNGGFEERFKNEAQSEEGVWDFVRTHLKYLPVTKKQGALLQFVSERDPRILFDQMVAFYVRKGFPVPISSVEFQIGLAQRFIERDGMYFLTDQAAEYDRKKAIIGQIQAATLFVFDESSAIQWLRQLIKDKPQTFSDINPQFMQQLGGWSKNEAQLDLRELLEQSFLCYDGKGPVPEQIHAYLSTNWKEMRNLAKDDPQLIAKAKDRWYVPDPNKAGDLEKLREKALLKEFEQYKESKKKLKIFRLEAVRAGFKKLWQDRTTESYRTIIEVAEKIPNNVLEEDPKLLMWYDQAVTRLRG